jgi:hypothetical protein
MIYFLNMTQGTRKKMMKIKEFEELKQQLLANGTISQKKFGDCGY